MSRAALVLSLVAATLLAGCLPSQVHDQSRQTLPPHPRLFADDARFARLDAFCATNDLGRAFRQAIIRESNGILPLPPVRRIVEGRRLLSVSRTTQHRLLRLGFAWRFTHDARYLARAVAELDALAAFPDWHPEHYLDVAEIELGFAVAYDWIYPALTPDQRARYAAALVNKGLRSGFTGPRGDKDLYCFGLKSNWNEVCNGGAVAAAFAVAESDPELANRVVDRAVSRLPRVLQAYAPHGAYPEGATYWEYGTDFGVIALELIREMRGTDYGLSRMPGLAETCDYPDRMTGTTGRLYNFGDCGEWRCPAFAMWWLAARYNRPDALAPYERKAFANWCETAGRPGYPPGEGDRLLPLAAFWFDQPIPPARGATNAGWYSGDCGTPIVTFRLADGTWLAAKGGIPKSSHQHMDAGSFVYETGEPSCPASIGRFVVDPGKDNYGRVEAAGVKLWNDTPEGDRWTVLRCGPETHAIPRLDGGGQCVTNRARFIAFETNHLPFRAVLDLTPLYPSAAKATRTFTLAADGTLEVHDRFEGLTNGTRVTVQVPVPGQTQGKDGVHRLSALSRSTPSQDVTCELVPPPGAETAVIDLAKMRRPWERPFELNQSTRLNFTKRAGPDGVVDMTVTLRKTTDARRNPDSRAVAHPRLFVSSAAAFTDLAALCRTNREAAALRGLVLRKADAVLDKPVLARETDGRRITTTGLAIGRILDLAMAFRLTGERRYADRAIREMLAIAAFKDWNPSHYLDTSMLTFAEAIGYDWLYNELDEGQRATIRTAIKAKGLATAKPDMFWHTHSNNWGQVCHGGLLAGAVAIEPECPGTAAPFVGDTLRHLPFSMAAFAPSGAFPEGPGYWSFALEFNVVALEALRAAGADVGPLVSLPGFRETPDFLEYTYGAADERFNYCDCGPGLRHPDMPVWWFAKFFGRPVGAGERRAFARMLAGGAGAGHGFLALTLLYYTPGSGDQTRLATCWSGGGRKPIVALRTGWNTSDAYLALTAGKAAVSHGHMDAGSFVMDMGGVRWAEELGSENYASLEQRGIKLWNGDQNGGRWTILRYNQEGHNSLVIDGCPHRILGEARVVAAAGNHAELDLSPIYADAAASRRVTLVSPRVIRLDDVITAKPGTRVRWQMWTKADAATTPAGALLLRRDGRSLKLSATPPGTWLIQESAALQAPYDSPNPGLRRVSCERLVPASGRLVIGTDFELAEESHTTEKEIKQ